MFTQRNSSIFFIHWLGINLFLASFVLSSCSVLLSAQTVEKCNEQQALNWFETENAQHSRGELEQALENWEKAVTCYKELNSNQFIIALLINLASVYTERRNYTVSLDYLNQALDNLKNETNNNDLNNILRNAFVLENFGLTQSILGHYQVAIEYYQEALKTIEEININAFKNDSLKILIEEAKATNQANLANVYLELSDYETAQKLYENSLIIAKAIEDKRIQGNHLHN